MNKSKIKDQIIQSKLITTSNSEKFDKYVKNAVNLNTDFTYKVTNSRQQWINDIYNYNVNNNINIHQYDKVLINLITNYFKLYNKQLETKANIKYIVPKYRNRSIYKIFVDISNIKHTNDDVNITIFIYNRSNKYIINKLNKLDFTYSIRSLYHNKNVSSNNKHLALNNYNGKSNIANKLSCNSNNILSNNDNIQLINYNRISFKDNIMQYIDNILLNDLSNLNIYKKKIENQHYEIKPKYLKKNNKINRIKKINKNKLCLFTNIYNSNQERFIVCKKFTKLPNYIIRKLYNNNNIFYNIKLFNKNKYSFYNLNKNLNQKKFIITKENSKIFKIKKNNKINRTNKISRINRIYKRNSRKLFRRFKLNKIYKKKWLNKNRKYKKNIKLLKHYISKFKLIKSEIHLIKHLKHCFNVININARFNDKHMNNISSKLLTNMYNIYKLYNINDKKNYLINQLHKKFILYYKHMLVINKFKFENIYLIRLKEILSRLYNKNINFNIINLRYPSLNSNIYTQVICLKAKSRKFAIRTIFNKALNPLRLKKTLKFLYKNKNIQLNKFKNVYINKNNKDMLINNINYCFKIYNNTKIEDFIFSSLKNKYLKGVKLQGKGRLTKRLIASRSIFKYGQKGSIRNFKSSYTGLYGYLLRAHIDSNIQYTKLESKNRNGAFGLKG